MAKRSHTQQVDLLETIDILHEHLPAEVHSLRGKSQPYR
jgi:hypothetical protein